MSLQGNLEQEQEQEQAASILVNAHDLCIDTRFRSWLCCLLRGCVCVVRASVTPAHLSAPPPAAPYPLLWVQEDLGVKELVTVTVLALPLGHQFAEAGGITDEACGWWGTHRDRHLAPGL